MGALVESKLAFAEFAAEFFQEMSGEQKEVIAAVAQRRNGERDGGNAEVEIFAKEFFPDADGEIAIGGDDDADVDFDGLRAAHAFEAAFFEDPQKLGLAGEREFADFVEKQRAALGHFDFAGLAIAGSGERAAFVAEEFVFDETFGNGGAVQAR